MALGRKAESAHFTFDLEFSDTADAAFQRRAIVKEWTPINHWNMHHARS
jgi:hypothetical protein